MLILGIALSLPIVQTKIAQYATSEINKSFGTDINIDQVSVSIFGGVKLKKVLINDHHKDTLIYATRIKTNILNLQKLTKGDLLFGDLRADGLIFNLKNYKGEEESNINIFVKLFENDKPSTKPFILKINNLFLTNSHFRVINENAQNPKSIDFTKMNAELNDFEIHGSDITTHIEKLSLLDHRGLFIENLNTDLTYGKEKLLLERLNVTTSNSTIKGGITMNYPEGGMADFSNKVNFNIDLEKANLSTTDLNYFYNEFGKDQKFTLKTNAKGTLNDFYTHTLELNDTKSGSLILGDVHFKNLFSTDKDAFYLKGDFEKLSSNYNYLKALLPRVVGEKLPSSLDKLGQFDIIGSLELTKTTINADLVMNSQLGDLQTNLVMTNIDNIDNATYKGNIVLDNFSIGSLLNQKDLGSVSLDMDVDGKGFTVKTVNTILKGNVRNIRYNGYTYNDIDIDGKMKMPFFKGTLNINDPNLRMSFNGLVDRSSKENNYDFHAQIDYADLHKLNFMKKDSISVFKGDLKFKAAGNEIDNIHGELNISQTSYQNQNDSYFFEDFTITSSFDENRVKTITINSPDIIQGKIVGKYQFGQLPKMVENALGSLYANYSPNKVKSGQFLQFNFTIYNKIIEIFYPQISLGNNTTVRALINSDTDEFKLKFDSPSIEAFENYFDKIKIDIDNKNPLYNAYVELDSIKTKNYKISDFSIINVTSKDTLFFRSEFKGGKDNKDYFNLNLYHTIDKDNKSVVGFKKSEINFKNFIWFLNEKQTNDNKIVFNKSLTDFSIEKIIMSHENENIELTGMLKDSTYKDLNLSFHDVDLAKITPSIDSLDLSGRLKGEINFKQNKNVFQPTSSITISDLTVNKNLLGDLNLSISGNESLRKFNIDAYLDNDGNRPFSANGDLEIINKETFLTLDLRMDKFNLAAFSPFGGNIVSNIRGFASGSASFRGSLKDPEINGRIYLEKTGMRVTYLNVDYEFDKSAFIDLTEQQLLFRNITMRDTKHNTSGKLNGSVRHKNFKNWVMDLTIKSDNLLVLDTKDSDDAAYFGTAYIEGGATIKGPTNSLFINVDAKSKKGTSIKIPVNSAQAIGNNSFIHFLSPKEKYNIENGIVQETIDYNGLELKFDLDITPDAEIEIILDRNTGHGIKGKGFGTILLDINTLGKFNMWGSFQAYEGSYNFKYGGLIDKKFEVKSGGSINWEGDPLKAILNIEAVYKTTANPAVLIDNPSFNRKIPVEVVIALKGNLTNPEPDFNIEFPSVSSVMKSEIQYKLDDKDTRQTQALYLLSSGSFLSSDNVGESAITGNLFERASSLFNDIFEDKDGKFSVGLNYQQSTRNPNAQTEDSRVGFTISTQINENISINGKLGVPVGGSSESVVVGDVEILLRLNEDRSLNMRVFNRENDISYLGEGIGYTQGVGISYQVDFDTFRELLRRIFNNSKKTEQVSKATDEVPDSDIAPEFIQFIESRGKKNEKRRDKDKHKVERVPEVD
ncbi:translocation/assembly module TamB domain-containing protein [Flavobacterium sp. '19STA2R22 D10 B1']|uniref:translocation/assembly module TamB domain-containing protein n=1 Tax=Flavobacterium aerium TaxID=3037261 RepID=UPI00278C52DF|nr:translocation/assembly module TamB domain-containing protein [Flavobacterium sp. '19STA2R22 D10 B1']